MTAVPQWQARMVHVYGGKRPHVLAASLQEVPARLALSAALRDEAMARLAESGRLWGEDRTGAMQSMYLHKAFNSAADAVEFGADAIELLENRWELVKTTEEITTPTSTE